MRFSIITINFNNQNGLQRTITSILGQSFNDFEFLIIDGGSIDGSLEVIQKYESEIDYYVSEQDDGVYDAMNKGIKKAKGDYLIFMNSGDCFYNASSLELYANSIDETNADVYYGNTIGEEGGRTIRSIIQPIDLNLSFWLFSTLNHQATAIKRELFVKYGFYDQSFKISSDWYFFIKMYLNHSVRFIHINEFVARYDLTGISSLSETSLIHQQERDFIIENRFPVYWKEYNALKELERIKDHKTKRQLHFEYIQGFPVANRIMKTFMSFILLFLPKRQ